MEADKSSWRVTSAIVAVDASSFCYRVCSVCERTIDAKNNHCNFCDYNAFNPGSTGSKLLFRILLSIATEDRVFVVICFDRAARVLFGCSANEFFDFAKHNPFAATAAAKVLEGEMFKMTLSKPKNANAQHLRVVSILPLRSGFEPAIVTLRKLFAVGRS